MDFIHSVGDDFFLPLDFLRRGDDFLPVLQQSLNKLEFVEAQKFKQIILQRIVGFRGKQHLFQRGGHFRGGKTRASAFRFGVGVKSRYLTAQPQEIERVAPARAARVLQVREHG